MSTTPKTTQTDPADYASESEFVDACVTQMMSSGSCDDEDDAEDRCQIMWEQRSIGDGQIIRKTHVSQQMDLSQAGIECVMSDESPDRYNDILRATERSWVLDNFRKNNIALFNHNPDAPIGTWDNSRVEKGALRGRLILAPKESSPRIAELHALINAGVLKSVSVGFRPLESCPRTNSKSGGIDYQRMELVECSLVSIPANPNALAVAKSLQISPETLGMVFSKRALAAPRQRVITPQVKTIPVPDQAVNAIEWQGQKIPIKRVLHGTWGGQKLYRTE